MTISVTIARETQTITWQIETTVEEQMVKGGMVVADITGMSEQLKERAMYHGLVQRGTDAGAMGFGHWDGKDRPKRYATDDEKLTRIARVVSHLNNPDTGWDWDLRPSSDPLANKSQAELEQLIKAAQAKLEGLGVK